MKTIEAIHKLNESEKQLLQSLIGKKITSIHADGVQFFSQKRHYSFTGPLNVVLTPFDKAYYIFSYSFYENQLGEEYYTSNIYRSIKPVQVNTSPEGNLQVHHAQLSMSAEFIIERICIYGIESEYEIKNDIEPRYWSILKENPGVTIKSVVSTEHILLFRSTKGEKMVIYPSSALPWIEVSFEEEIISNIENAAEFNPFNDYKLKYIIQ